MKRKKKEELNFPGMFAARSDFYDDIGGMFAKRTIFVEEMRAKFAIGILNWARSSLNF